MQKHVNLVDLVKRFPTNIFLQNLVSIQKRTSPIKLAHLAEKSEKGSISNLSTKVQLDPSVIPRVVDGLSTRGLAETHIAPLVNKLRSAGVHMPSSVLSATIRGVATEVKGKEQTKDAVDVPPWRRQRNNVGASNSPNMARTRQLNYI